MYRHKINPIQTFNILMLALTITHISCIALGIIVGMIIWG
jgi:hypothetical protein